MSGIAVNIRGRTELLSLQDHHWVQLVAAAADLGGSRVGWRMLCLTLGVVPGSSWRIFSLYTAGAFSCLNNCLRKRKGEKWPSKSIGAVHPYLAGSKWVTNHWLSLNQISGRTHTRLFLCEMKEAWINPCQTSGQRYSSAVGQDRIESVDTAWRSVLWGVLGTKCALLGFPKALPCWHSQQHQCNVGKGPKKLRAAGGTGAPDWHSSIRLRRQCRVGSTCTSLQYFYMDIIAS